ncbi:MFS transporter [Pseudomonas sp. Marseille-QA0892]
MSTEQTAHPEGASRRATGKREGLVLMLASSLTIMGAVMVAPILPKLGAEFGPVDPRADVLIPLLVTGPALAIAIVAPVAGWLSDRIGRKALLVIATLLYAILGALPTQLADLTSIVGARLLFGCTEAAIMTCCAALIADYWQGEERMRYVNLQVITIGLVGSLFFLLGGILGEHSWRLPFYLYLLPLLLVPAMLKVLWEPQRRAVVHTVNDRSHVSVPTLVLGYLLILGGMIVSFVVPVQAPLLLAGLGVTSSTLIGACVGVGLLATLGGSLSWGFLRRAIGIAGCNALLLTLMAVGLWLLINAEDYRQVLAAVCVHGLGAGLLVPNAMAPVMNALTPNTRGRGLGAFTGFLYIGQFVSPLIVALLSAFGYDLRGAIGWLATASLVAACAWLLGAVLLPRRAETVPHA